MECGDAPPQNVFMVMSDVMKGLSVMGFTHSSMIDGAWSPRVTNLHMWIHRNAQRTALWPGGLAYYFFFALNQVSPNLLMGVDIMELDLLLQCSNKVVYNQDPAHPDRNKADLPEQWTLWKLSSTPYSNRDKQHSKWETIFDFCCLLQTDCPWLMCARDRWLKCFLVMKPAFIELCRSFVTSAKAVHISIETSQT